MRIATGRANPYPPFFVEIGNEQHGTSIKPYLKIFSEQVDAMLAVPSAQGKLKYLVGTSILTTYPDDDIKALFDYCRGKPVSKLSATAFVVSLPHISLTGRRVIVWVRLAHRYW